jgi:DNA topoisomerase VI subunit A
MDNLRQISRITFECHELEKIVLCENESPFNQLLRENTASVYTAGFPNSAVKKFISILEGEFELMHWGDTDPEGLEIAALLNNIKPVKLYRCQIEDCKRLQHALKELGARKHKRAVQLLTSYNFPFKKELEFTINNGWLEQEAWMPFE